MNDFASDKRNSLHLETVSMLMFLSLKQFDPLPHVCSWLERGHRKPTTWVPEPQSASKYDNKHYDLMGCLLTH